METPEQREMRLAQDREHRKTDAYLEHEHNRKRRPRQQQNATQWELYKIFSLKTRDLHTSQLLLSLHLTIIGVQQCQLLKYKVVPIVLIRCSWEGKSGTTCS